MFTGIIEEVGFLRKMTPTAQAVRIEISACSTLQDTRPGDSISVNGICLTVVEIGEDYFAMDAVKESVSNTTITLWETGDELNLERAMPVAGRLGGHLVQGHIDGMGTVKNIWKVGNDYRFLVETSEELMRYIVHKGSIAVDGISLTVAEVNRNAFTVAVIPHTYSNTNIHRRKIGDRINLETDIIARYVEKFIQSSSSGRINEEFLRKAGF